jgi:hypothetical protein
MTTSKALAAAAPSPAQSAHVAPNFGPPLAIATAGVLKNDCTRR